MPAAVKASKCVKEQIYAGKGGRDVLLSLAKKNCRSNFVDA